MRTTKDACLLGIKGIFPPVSQHPHLAAVGHQSGSGRSRSRQQTAGRRPSYVSSHKHKPVVLAVTMKLCSKQSSCVLK